MHYRKAHGALLVYDVTNILSFINTRKWLERIKENTAPDIKIALVGNKVDLIFKSPAARKVATSEAKKFARENDLIFIGESSAANDYNIKEVFEDLLQSSSSP